MSGTFRVLRETQYGFQLENGSFVNASQAVKDWVAKSGTLPAMIEVIEEKVGPKGGISWGKVKYISPLSDIPQNSQQRAPVSQNRPPQRTYGGFQKEKPSDKALTMLVSYAKDIVCEEIKLVKPEYPLDVKALFAEANERVWESYDFFKNKLEAGQ